MIWQVQSCILKRITLQFNISKPLLFSGLHPLAKQHAGILSQHHITGQDLLALTWSTLDNMKVC